MQASVTIYLLLLTCSYTCLVSSSRRIPRRFYDTVIIGGGPGGIYSGWRLLTGEFKNGCKPGRVAIFEGLDRIGGRIRPVGHDEVPEISKEFVLELGAYRYRTHRHIMTTALVEDVFEVPTRCYQTSNVDFELNGPRDPGDCPGGDAYFVLRNHEISADDLFSNSSKVPYFLRDSEKYGQGLPNAEPLIGFEIIASAYPQIDANIPLLTDPDPKVRWTAYSDTLAAMRAAGIQLPGGVRIDGNSIDANTFIGERMSAEARALADVINGNGDLGNSLFAEPMYYNALFDVRSAANSVGNVASERAVIDEEGRPGFLTWVNRMKDKYEDAGGHLFYNHDMIAFFKRRNYFRIHFKNGRVES